MWVQLWLPRTTVPTAVQRTDSAIPTMGSSSASASGQVDQGNRMLSALPT